jgi:LmbE family N-acetylglucosaminyl deacetylase
MNALCLVAHPDDCVIFGYSYIYNHPEFNWTVCYLTYTADTKRGQEFVKFWNSRSIKTVFLGFLDDYRDQESQRLNFWYGIDAETECWRIAKDFDLVLTHDAEGDYGHIHHRVVHNGVKQHPNLITFAPPGQGNTTYTVPESAYSIEELPLHAEVIKGFHPSVHRNSYNKYKDNI